MIKVWGKGEGGKWVLQAELEGHTGSVWKVCWAHPVYGQGILASCSADKTVKIWEEHVDPEAKKPWIWKRRAQFLESIESVETIEFQAFRIEISDGAMVGSYLQNGESIGRSELAVRAQFQPTLEKQCVVEK